MLPFFTFLRHTLTMRPFRGRSLINQFPRTRFGRLSCQSNSTELLPTKVRTTTVKRHKSLLNGRGWVVARKPLLINKAILLRFHKAVSLFVLLLPPPVLLVSNRGWGGPVCRPFISSRVRTCRQSPTNRGWGQWERWYNM